MAGACRRHFASALARHANPALLAGLILVSILAGPPALRGAPHDAALPSDLRALLERLAGDGGIAVGGGDAGAVVIRPGNYIPASTIKLATALAALGELGPDYRFATEVWLDGERNLVLRGLGDPFLVSEEWRLIATELGREGLFDEELGGVVVDSTAFAPETLVDGAGESLNPYDARLGALISNFNTINLEITADGKVRSAEPQTPLTPLARELARGLIAGKDRKERINLSLNPGHGPRYSGELAQAIFSEAGARFRGAVSTGAVPPGARLVLRHLSSRPLREVLRAMMEFSNNFIANQIVMAMHLEAGGNPARLEAGVARVDRYVTSLFDLAPDDLVMVEGSGLSRRNRVGLEAMLSIVEGFAPWRDLLQPHHGKNPQAIAKTGTLTGVSSLAGYFPSTGGGWRPFVIMLNRPRKVRLRVFRLLASHYAQRPLELGR